MNWLMQHLLSFQYLIPHSTHLRRTCHQLPGGGDFSEVAVKRLGWLDSAFVRVILSAAKDLHFALIQFAPQNGLCQRRWLLKLTH
jgi:hypothetical protein